LFTEDIGHEKYVGKLIRRIAAEYELSITIQAVSVRGGHGKVFTELRAYLVDIRRNVKSMPDILVVAVDANKRGVNKTRKEINDIIDKFQMPDFVVHAVPDPHIERWMLIDGSAFSAVFGKGCNAPDNEFGKSRYKKLLIEAIQASGTTPLLGGMEFADDIVDHLNLEKIRFADKSFGDLLHELEAMFRRLTPHP